MKSREGKGEKMPASLSFPLIAAGLFHRRLTIRRDKRGEQNEQTEQNKQEQIERSKRMEDVRGKSRLIIRLDEESRCRNSVKSVNTNTEHGRILQVQNEQLKKIPGKVSK